MALNTGSLFAAMRSLSGAGVSVAEATGRPAPDDTLLEAEEQALGAVAKRRRDDYVAGRSCARRALAGLGVEGVPILRGANREPRWPGGIVGSITHCPGFAAAAVARDERVASIGIDAERLRPLPWGVIRKVALPTERAWLASRDERWACALFSAKESVFKAWFPLTHRWLGFHDALVTFDVDARAFVAELVVDAPVVRGRRLDRFEGSFVAACELVATAVVVPAVLHPLPG